MARLYVQSPLPCQKKVAADVHAPPLGHTFSPAAQAERTADHFLRLAARRPEESLDHIRQQVSEAAREEDESYEAVGDAAG